MTESEWLASTRPDLMLDHVESSASVRQLQCFVEVCRSRWRGHSGGTHYDDLGSLKVIAQVWCSSRYDDVPKDIVAAMLRDIFGNPFRRVLWQRGPEGDRDSVGMVLGSILSWNDGTVPKLAQAIAGGETCKHGFAF